MKSRNIIICALCAAVLTLGLAACHNKKKIAEARSQQSTEQQTEQQAEAAKSDASAGPTVTVPPEPLPEPAPVPEPNPTPAIEPIVELVEGALEETPVEPAGWRPQYQTAYGKGMVSILYKQQRLSSPVTVTYIADSIVVASVQPLLGIEMYRLEALPDRARLFEKLNRRYVEMSYEEISIEAKRFITFELVERMVEEVGLTFPIGQDTTLRYSGVEATLSLQYRTVNERVQAFPISTNGYNRTTINAILSK
ncbi:MAG: DUF4292 domain-containing protein [Paludibacteraceae bacterium]|nr:DUF4292 domain-containing protein [Paludibacteraceae bacterium]